MRTLQIVPLCGGKAFNRIMAKVELAKRVEDVEPLALKLYSRCEHYEENPRTSIKTPHAIQIDISMPPVPPVPPMSSEVSKEYLLWSAKKKAYEDITHVIEWYVCTLCDQDWNERKAYCEYERKWLGVTCTEESDQSGLRRNRCELTNRVVVKQIEVTQAGDTERKWLDVK